MGLGFSFSVDTCQVCVMCSIFTDLTLSGAGHHGCVCETRMIPPLNGSGLGGNDIISLRCLAQFLACSDPSGNGDYYCFCSFLVCISCLFLL